jgi:hypothetical protein
MSIVPPWASISLREIGSPSPVPRALVEKNGWKILSRFFGSIPSPSSATAISTPAPLRRTLTRAVPPLGIEWTAFCSRFSSTCCR